MYLRRFEAHLRTHCCRGQEKSFMYYERVHVTLLIQHADRIVSVPYYSFFCGLSVSALFSHIIS